MYAIDFGKLHRTTAMNAPTKGTTGAIRFRRMIRSSRTRSSCVQPRIIRSTNFGRWPRSTTSLRTHRNMTVLPTTSPPMAIARRRAAQGSGSVPGVRYRKLRTTASSGRAGMTAASMTKTKKRARSVPAGPRNANRPESQFATVAMERASVRRRQSDEGHLEHEGPAHDLLVEIQAVRPGGEVDRGQVEGPPGGGRRADLV